MERGSLELGGKAAYVIGDVEIQSVRAGALNPDVFGVWAKGLEFSGQVERDFGLVRAAEDLGFEWASAKLSQVLGLNVLEVDKYDVGSQVAVVRFDADGSRNFMVTGRF